MSKFVLNETAYFGAGCRNELKGEIQKKGYKKAFIVTDNDLIKFKVIDKIVEVVEGVIPYEIFSDVKANPTIKNVHNGLKKFRDCGADLLIAVGGGSVIDTAKAIGIIFNNPSFEDVKSLEGVANTKNASVPIFALPTTAGTAAEVTINYVITDEDSHRKLVCVDPNDIPKIAFIDAELMSSMPKGLTAATGMDALTHAIEGYITKGAWEMSNMVELEAIKLISLNLRNAVANGNNIEAREGMALGQYIAGMGFSNVGLGAVHSMAHPLGARFDTPHGVANAVLLPVVMQFNMEGNYEKYKNIAIAMGEDVSKKTLKEAAQTAVDAVKKLSNDIGIPKNLTEIGIKAQDLEVLSKDAIVDACIGGNPNPITVEDILKLYKIAL
ncbi:MAG: lactaldehyde reductase [Clostridia bacterium]